jgi:hypothetical protein
VVTLGELVCSPPESQLVSHDSLRSSDGSGFGNSPSTRDTCIASLNATTSSIATARCWLDATSFTADPAYLNENRRPWSSSLDASQACKAGSSAARAASTEEQSEDGSAISVSPGSLVER